MKKQSEQTYPNDLYVLSMQRFLILELDLDNSRTQSRTIASVGGWPFRKVLIILREKERER